MAGDAHDSRLPQVQSGLVHRRHLQNVERRRVEEEKRNKGREPHALPHTRHASNVPQRGAVVAVVDKVHDCEDGEGEGDEVENHSIGPGAQQLFT